MTASTRLADTREPLLEVLAARWSPRAFDPAQPVAEADLIASLEAARWAPSASNRQPRRFLVARRGSSAFDAVVDHLVGFNQAWAASAPVLIVNVAQLRGADGTENRWAEYDLGQAVAHLSVQAHHAGLHVHQIGGFDAAGLAEAFDLGEHEVVVSVTALGYLGDASALPESYRERESAPRERRPFDEVVEFVA